MPQDEPLLSEPFLRDAGTSSVDWYPFGMGRVGYPDDYASYVAIMRQKVSERYQLPGKLSEAKATEWHRISLAYLASGGDATDVSGHNLIADGTYDRGKTANLGTQGLNGLIWALLTLDALDYDVPKNAFEQRADIIGRIEALQLENGGFSIDQKEADVDMTAMVLTALAPYYNDEKTYEHRLFKTTTVRETSDRALQWLSKQQQDTADFMSGGIANLESTAQVAVALTSLHIDIETDARFIKKGQNVYDAMIRYELPTGGFIHAKTYNASNPTSKPDEANSMASEQALYALVALLRQEEKLRTLYDLRPEQSAQTKKAIAAATTKIEQLTTNENTWQQALRTYENVPREERRYVRNYAQLADVVKKKKGTLPADLTENNKQSICISPMPTLFETKSTGVTELTDADAKAVAALLAKEPSTEQEVDVAKALDRFQRAKNATNYTDEQRALTKRQADIADVKEAIQQLNERILQQLYPFDALTLKDAAHVDEIMASYEALPTYDQHQIIKYEDVEKAQTQMKALRQKRYITYGGVALLVVAITGWIVWKRRQRKEDSV
ncbi:prenyltransferase/squalene oxidase repeat-containing protein [Kurthia senegalensis]|uniref:prenyltransferase/squalene oxidase repeat-containing protein n=1 Tax=Kurthia senegalensis TaxID=1033740 RepID=UPI0002891E07|nr:prenyltransferase/squalene oxidase repeat-containing protein [Kurthia senegalensis]